MGAEVQNSAFVILLNFCTKFDASYSKKKLKK